MHILVSRKTYPSRGRPAHEPTLRAVYYSHSQPAYTKQSTTVLPPGGRASTSVSHRSQCASYYPNPNPNPNPDPNPNPNPSPDPNRLTLTPILTLTLALNLSLSLSLTLTLTLTLTRPAEHHQRWRAGDGRPDDRRIHGGGGHRRRCGTACGR